MVQIYAPALKTGNQMLQLLNHSVKSLEAQLFIIIPIKLRFYVFFS